MNHRATGSSRAAMVAAGSLLATLLLALASGGCVTPGGQVGEAVAGASSWMTGGAGTTEPAGEQEQGLTPEERRMREQSKAFQRTVWEGALIGAGAGTLWGVIQGDRGTALLQKVLIGGAVGGLAGAYIGHKQNQYASTEDQLDSMIADVRQSNAETTELIASVRTVIAEDKRRLADVQKRYKKGQATQAEVADTRGRIKGNQAVVAQATKGAREKYGMFQGAERELGKRSPGTNTAGLKKELNTYNEQIETLDGLAGSISVA